MHTLGPDATLASSGTQLRVHRNMEFTMTIKSRTKSGGLFGPTYQTVLKDSKSGRWVSGGGRTPKESRQNADKRRQRKGW